MSRLEQTDRIARGVLITAVALGCVSPFALGAWKEGGVADADAASRQFATLDRNHDGRLSWSEAHRVPGLEVVFTQSDLDRDGSLNHAEFRGAQSALAYQAVLPEPGATHAVKVKGALFEQQYLPSLAMGVENL